MGDIGKSMGANIGSGIVGTLGNMALSAFTNKKNIQNWNRQNAYNHPKMQMERLKSAGLNPNLVYGSGTNTQAGQIAQYSNPDTQKIETPSASEFMQKTQQATMLPEQKEQAQATIQNIKAETTNKGIESQLMNENLTNKKNQNMFSEKIYANQAEQGTQSIRIQKSQNKEIKARIANLKQDKRYKKFVGDMAENNINVNDPAYQRQLLRIFPWIKSEFENSPVGGTYNDNWWAEFLQSLKN